MQRSKRGTFDKPGRMPVLLEELFRAIEKTLVQRRIFLAAKCGKFFQLETLLAIQVCRHFNQKAREQIAAAASVHINDAAITQLKDLAALRSSGHFDVGLAVESRYGSFSTERGDSKRNGHFAKKIVVFTLKNFVLLHVHDDVKIAGRASAKPRFAIARGAQTRAVADASRNFKLDATQAFEAAFAVANATRHLDNLACAVTS